MKGCMNCGNISCGNNKKRDCAGCGRWISPEDKIAELEKDLSEEKEFRRSFIHDYREQVHNDNDTMKQWREEALKIMRDISACELMKVVTKAKQYLALEKLENFLKEIPDDGVLS